MRYMLKTKKPCSNFIREFKSGIDDTIPYLLSHHESKDYDKCLTISKYKICARCFGVYIGIILTGILHLNFYISPFVLILVVFLFPVFTLLDWTISTFSKIKSNNKLRIFSGLTLGSVFISGVLLLSTGQYVVFFPGIIYAGLAVILIIKKQNI